MVIFMLPCPEPQKLSQMVVNVPAVGGGIVTSMVFPRTKSASIFRALEKNPCFTSSVVTRNVTCSPFFNVIWLWLNSNRLAEIVTTRGASFALAWNDAAIATIPNNSHNTNHFPFFMEALLLAKIRRVLARLLHDDFAGHLWMNGAVIRIGAWIFELVRELLIRVQDRRGKLLVRAHDVVRHVVVVDPGHLRAGGNGQGRRRKTEVVDLDLIFVGIAWGTCALLPVGDCR